MKKTLIDSLALVFAATVFPLVFLWLVVREWWA